jgi:hypothetical protein
MKSILAILSSIGLVGCTTQPADTKPVPSRQSHQHHQHGHEQHGQTELIVQAELDSVQPEEPTKLTMMLHGADGKMLKDFETVHEQKLHLIIVRDALDRFDHIHPEIDPAGNITATHTFATPGTYKLFADFKPAGQEQAVAKASVKVGGDAPVRPELIPNVPGTVSGDGLTAEVSIEPRRDGHEVAISFVLYDSSGQPVTVLEPYLGAMGHLVIISADAEHYVHAHPVENSSQSNRVTFEAHFPATGLYKAWGQFQVAGKVFTVPAVLDIP